jgi:hypothetical protein
LSPLLPTPQFFQVQPANHRRPNVLGRTETFFTVAALVVMSLGTLSLIQATFLHAQSAVKIAPVVGGQAVAMRSAGKLGPEAVQLLCFSAMLLLLDTRVWWTCFAAAIVPWPVLALLRSIAVGIISREYGRTGEGVLQYVETCGPRPQILFGRVHLPAIGICAQNWLLFIVAQHRLSLPGLSHAELRSPSAKSRSVIPQCAALRVSRRLSPFAPRT